MQELMTRQEQAGIPEITYSQDQLDLIKRTYATDASNDELALFVHASKRLKLDIMARQIHFTKRKGKPVFIVSIDGYRLNAERTTNYAPGREPTFTYDDKKAVVSATAYVKKYVGGTWHEVAATAFMSEYKPDEDWMWRKMPHNQLAKCAEALALRRAFPNELSNTVTDAEMAQVREPEEKPAVEQPKPAEQAPAAEGDKISDAQRKRFYAIWKGANKTEDQVRAYLKEQIGTDNSTEIPKGKYDALCKWAETK